MLSINSRNGLYQQHESAPGDFMTLDQLRRYRDVVFPACVAQRPSISALETGVPFLSLECNIDWVTEKAAKLFVGLYLDPPGTQKDELKQTRTIAKKNNKKKIDFFDIYFSNSKSPRGGEEWTKKSRRDLVVVCAYRDFILPPRTALHPFFALANANNWVKDAPFALFEEWHSAGGWDLWRVEKKDPVFVFPPVIQGRDGIDGNYFPVGVDAEDECVGVGQQNLKHWRQPEAELDGQSLPSRMDEAEAIFERFFQLHGYPEEHSSR